MLILTALMLLLFVVIALALPFVMFFHMRAMRELSKRIDQEMHQDFDDTLKKYGVTSHEILIDNTVYYGQTSTTDVRKILFDQDGRYYLYLYCRGGPGALKPLSKERALLAAGTNGQISA